jgi:hypothetical protein
MASERPRNPVVEERVENCLDGCAVFRRGFTHGQAEILGSNIAADGLAGDGCDVREHAREGFVAHAAHVTLREFEVCRIGARGARQAVARLHDGDVQLTAKRRGGCPAAMG